MNRTAEPLARNPFSTDTNFTGPRHIPILPSSTTSTSFSQSDIMDITPPASAAMGPPANSSPDMEQDNHNVNGSTNNATTNGNHGEPTPTTNGTNGATLNAAAAGNSQQPKVVQTAFIHKLYNMLEDQSIRHLIAWSNTNESFVMSPTSDFSKVLAQYFKHTNISSFVRQLNMYGFHKVSDVFHTGAPESPLWEFKHGNGSFKRGDIAGLREIKRRASRHALIHRDSFSSPHKPSVSQPGTPAEPVPEVGDPRLTGFEYSLHDFHNRLARSEESNIALISKCAILSENLSQMQQFNNNLCQIVLKLIPDQESPVYRDLSQMQKEVARQAEMFRAVDEPHEPLHSSQRPYFSTMANEPMPLSPRQTAQDDRRPSIPGIPQRPPFFARPPAPPHLNLTPRRYGSIGNSTHSPSYHRPSVTPQPPAPPPQHPLASVSEPGPNLARRHTSADIRDTAGWPPQPQGSGGSPFEAQPPSAASTNWPHSPQIHTPSQGDQQVRDMLASYELGQPRRNTNLDPHSHSHSRQPSPPPSVHDGPPNAPASSNENGWGFSGGKFAPRLLDSAPPTRRSSMASNVHSLLNPADTTEREEEDPAEDRKRKRLG